MLRDVNRLIHEKLGSFNIAQATPNAFNGAIQNARGSNGGTSNPLSLFTVTGDVLIRIFGVCTTNLDSEGFGSISVGVTGNTAGLISITTATEININEIWKDNTPEAGTDPIANITDRVLINGLDIQEFVSGSDITLGQIYYICAWRPLSSDSTVVAV